MLRWVWSGLLVCLVLCVGCGKKKAAEVAQAKPSVQSSNEPDEVEVEAPTAPLEALQSPGPPTVDSLQDQVTEPGSDVADGDDRESPETTSEEPEAEDESSVDVAAGEPAEQPIETPDWSPAHRMFLPTTAGPLFVDVEIRFGDQLLADVFAKRIEQIIEEARGNSKSELTWNEFFEHVSSNPEQFDRQLVSNRGQYRQMIQQFDRNRNKCPDHDEVARFVFRNSGPGVPFRLIGTDYHREINRSASALFEAIDADGNKALDEAELENAPQALIRFDPNADQRIDAVELIAQQDNDPAWNRRRSNRRGEVAMDLDGYVDWSMLSYSIEGMFGRHPFGLADNLVDDVDENSDRSISSSEAKQLREVTADLRLKVTFGAASSGKPKIEVVWIRPELQTLTINDGGAVVSLTDGRFSLLATVTDRESVRNRIPREAFDMLDANNDGFLDEEEIPEGVPDELSLENLDADEDGKLTYEEITTAPRDAPKPAWAAQVRARGTEFPDGVFAFLDTNHDWFLSTREILNADARLRQCSVNRKVVRPAGIPDTFAIQFMHADPMQDQQNFAFVSEAAVNNSSWPRWAQHMDVNRDGEISQVEFPGSVTQFEALDTSGDGFIDSTELQNR